MAAYRSYYDGLPSPPDIVCLQELKAPDEKFPVLALKKAGYGAIWHGQRSWNGVAILARGAVPMERRRGLPAKPMTYIAGTSKPKSVTSSSAASTCRTAIPRRDRNSITNSAGSID